MPVANHRSFTVLRIFHSILNLTHYRSKMYCQFISGKRRVYECLALPCLGPLAPRGAVGARHDGLPRQFSPLLPVVCHGLSLSEGFAGPLCDVITPALFRPAPSSTAFDCSL